MLKNVARKIFGSYADRYTKKLLPMVQEINSLEENIKKLSNEELKAKTDEFRKALENGKTEDDILTEAFAVARESSVRTMGMRHYDVQMMGAYALHKGKIAEMKTGEGKTLVATLAMYLNGISGKGAHLVTVNDYLARRDAQWMAPVYLFLGLTVGIIQHMASFRVEWDNEEELTTKIVECDRDEAYAADITYGTNNEFGFDYLRDNMKSPNEPLAQRPLHYAIVDEVDSILIDEARTPLIISGPTESGTDHYYEVNSIVKDLEPHKHYKLDEKNKSAQLIDEGINAIEAAMKIDNLFDIKYVDMLHHFNNSIKAHALYKKDVDYVVKDGEVIIVDEFTGRLQPGRRYADGMHQALEAKEGVKIESENQTLASITFQNYFRMYEKLSGMTGTALTEAHEFLSIYNLEVAVIPTHMKMIRKDNPDVIFRTVTEKLNAIADEIEEMHKEGRPVLVGTSSIEKTEIISSLLNKRKIKHEVLNAKNHEREAEIIKDAGEKGAVTIATNMAGRGTDIKLGEGVKELGGLHILGTDRHESRRIDNQLRGRAGRQGDPGSSRFYVSLEDDLMRIFGSEKISSIMEKLGMKEGESIEHPIISKSIEGAQKKVEGFHFEIRKHLLDYDNVMNQQRNVIYSLRKDIITGEATDAIITETIDNVLNNMVEVYVNATDKPDFDEFEKDIEETFGISFRFSEDRKEMQRDLNQLDKLIEDRVEERRDQFGGYFEEVIRFLYINILDNRWKENLLQMDYLRDSVGLRGYGQKDPLNEYKREAFNLFVEMMNKINYEVVKFLFHVQVQAESDVQAAQQREKLQTTEEHKDIFAEEKKEQKKKPITRDYPKVGRNDPCPCGSGKKYKKCHGQAEDGNDTEETNA
ncbi:preprotein translocase, SecA subunit [Denitrovibrio acetiphilus DSM 12809]|uniref:Protein translocase subunit SecA n=1 Tax=Denitrovibrio acetiphilus (strain DSM 12809 / NBRC 114555 / N2460) TaxID=522772 RepID=D4H5V9_DENA2|nr:preprotein translocase subunit SecA [Denitrovibrio acetiphilus]ADD69550.1 preprotein translocase, SecA subunit [Denitrovibrio acetiphilus DSM 12809]